MANLTDLEIRPYRVTDTPALTDTHRACFQSTIEDAYFRWKYQDNPAGPVVGFVAASGPTIAAFYGLIPERYQVSGSSLVVYQSMDTMTHPKFQRRGLFAHLAQVAYDHLARADAGTRLIGIAGPTSLPGFTGRLGWRKVRDIRYVFAHKVQFRATTLLRRGAKPEVIALTAMDSKLSYFLGALPESRSAIAPLITPAHFEWRVFKNQSHPFHVLGSFEHGKLQAVAVYTLAGRSRGFFHFLGFRDDSAIPSHLPALTGALLRVPGVATAYTWEPAAAPLAAGLRRCGFLPNPLSRGPFSYRIPLITRLAGPAAADPLWSDGGNFDVQPLMQD